MDVNEEEVLISLRNMRNSDEELHENGVLENGHAVIRHASYQPSNKISLQWLDLRVFYVKVSKCVIDKDSTPEVLTLNHVPLNRDTLLEVNCVRTSIYSDGVSTLLKRDRLDKRSEEVTFVCTDGIRMTGDVKFEVFHGDALVLSGSLELCHSNGFIWDSKNQGPRWIMNCESDTFADIGCFKGNHCQSPAIEVYVAGSFSGNPIILTKTLQIGCKKKQTRNGKLKSIPEYEAKDDSSTSTLTMPSRHYPDEYVYKQEEVYHSTYSGIEYLESEGEDGELSWFNAGVRVGVGIGLSICLGVGIGVGLLARTYQGTTKNFMRRLI